MELSLTSLSRRFGAKHALEHITLSLQPGITGLVGPNGSGKTTLLRILATTLAPSSGGMRWNGADAVAHPDALRRDLAYMPQNFAGYPRLNAREFVSYLHELRGTPAPRARRLADDGLEALGLAADAKRAIGTFTPGMTQRLGIAYILNANAPVVLLDEPTAGLDPLARGLLCDALLRTARERIVVICTHIFDDLELLADRVLALRAGSVLGYEARDAFVARARGRVWEVRLDAYPDRLAGRVTSQRRHDGGLLLRVVNEGPPLATAHAVEPRLEDACALADVDGLAW